MVEHGVAQPTRRLRPTVVSPALQASGPATRTTAHTAAHTAAGTTPTMLSRTVEIALDGAAEAAADRPFHAASSTRVARSAPAPDRALESVSTPEDARTSGMDPVANSRFEPGPFFDRASGDSAGVAVGCGRFEAISAESSECGLTRTDRVGELYKSFYHRVFCFARRSVADEEAEEVAHETFVRLLRVRNLETMSIGVAYLLRIAENLLKRKHERAQRYRVVLERSSLRPSSMVVLGGEEACDPGSDREFGACGGVVDWFDSDRIHSAMCRLTSEEQTAIRLIVCEGLDYQAAARSMGVRVSTINNWKHRGLAKLKQLVGINRPAQHSPASAAG